MDAPIRVEDQFYILATASLADERTRVLKHDDTFGVFDHYGDIQPVGLGEQGLYHLGTRFLNRLVLTLYNHRPLLLSSTVREDNTVFGVDLTNPDIYVNGQVVLPRGTLHIFRAKFLWRGICYESLRMWNYGSAPVNVFLTYEYQADFADIFEVRGLTRASRGQRAPDTVEDGWVGLTYQGLDGVVRRTRISYTAEPPVHPVAVSGSALRAQARIGPREEASLVLAVACEDGERERIPERASFEEAFAELGRTMDALKAEACEISTSNEWFNSWLRRSLADLWMMTTQTAEGPYPYAGVPWFSTPFGRDGIITALELLWVNPRIAAGVLAYLAATQARAVIPEQEAEPGKILHETRSGEMAALGEIPFGRYYGSVDATPLFVLLAGAYFERTADRALIETIWPQIEAALQWIDTYGDPDNDGFVEYARRSPKGLLHQGWKDSQDAIFHADGSPAEAPIALCEVQGYVFAAKQRAAVLADALGHPEIGSVLRREAAQLREAFERSFWCEELSTYVLALDGGKRPCRVRTSNAGHALFASIAGEDRAHRTAQTLLAKESFSGWGIRTVAASERRYNPMSYHNGSIWPHDNALIAQGLAQYGLQSMAVQIFTGLFDTSAFVDLHRLPELFCGFAQRPGRGPTLYPVACAPQAWSAGAVFLLLQACLGLSVQASDRHIRFSHPVLPEWLQRVRITNLRVGKASVDLSLERHGQSVSVGILRREGDLKIVVYK